MDFATLFTEQRWNIITALCEDKYSPLQLAEKANTTMANISQQLRLLEASNIVKKEKISNRDKGKPRALFSLSGDYAYIICAMKGFCGKKLIKLNKLQSIMVRLMLIDDDVLLYYLEKFIWDIEEYIEKIEFLAFKKSDNIINSFVVSVNPMDLNKKLKDRIIKKPNGDSKIFKIKLYTPEEAEKLAKQHKGPFLLDDFHVVYDPYRFMKNKSFKGIGYAHER